MAAIVFIVLDPASALPVWLPENHVRFNYAEYGLEQAIGAIKARVQENGGQLLPLTPVKRVEIFKAEESFRRDKARMMNSEEGAAKVFDNVAELFSQVKKHCTDVNAQGSLQIRCGIDLKKRSQIQTCAITDGRVGVRVVWYQQFSNTLDKSSLIIREYKGGLILPGESGLMYINQSRQLCETEYSPDLSLAREYGWRQGNATEFLSPSALAELCVIRLVDLAGRYARGEMKD